MTVNVVRLSQLFTCSGQVFRDAAGTEEMCDTEIEKHKLARRLAKRFNKLVPDERCRINFTLPLKSTVERMGVGCYLTRHKTRYMDKKEWVLIEDNLVKKVGWQIVLFGLIVCFV